MSENSENSININRMAIAIIITVIVGIAIFLSYRVNDAEQKREIVIWQNHMATVINGRVDAISTWISRHNNSMVLLSENQSIQLYMSTNNEDLGLSDEGNEALLEYILPLLNDRANQMGFVPAGEERRLPVNANVERLKTAGLALTNVTGQILMATADMPSVLPAVTAYVENGAGQAPLMIGPFKGESGHSTVAFITPVYSMTADESSQASGFLIGIKPLDSDFFNVIKQPGETVGSAKNRIIFKKGEQVQFIQEWSASDNEFIAPIGSELVERAAAFAIENPGRYALKRDESGEEVLVSSLEVDNTDWVFIRSIRSDEAYGGVRSRMRNMTIIMFLSVLGLGTVFVLIWRHGVTMRLKTAIEKEKDLVEKYERLSTFMKVVTNSQPTEIAAVDENFKYTFVNEQAAAAAESNADDMIGKTPSAVQGKANAKVDEIHIEEVLTEGNLLTKIRHFGKDETLQAFKTDYIPISGLSDDKGVLVVKEDITDIERNRIKRELGLTSLISTLTMIIGSRDPFSRTHSERVVSVTNILCQELAVDETMSATAELAGAMMNLGKILVPREILTKPGKLSAEELKIIRDSMLKSADMIKDIEFEGPVSETLRQIQAHWDGSGEPTGLSGEDILMSARIVSVANAFVGMTSARAHRNGLDMSHAITMMMDEGGKKYDRRPVVALMNYLENKGGLKKWAHFGSVSEQ